MNRVTEILGVKYPIIQAPMGWIARSQLASAVSNAGGFGIIETSSGEVDQCKEEIRKMIADADRDGSGVIDFPEFLDMMTQKMAERDPREEMLKAFRLFDDDETGKISFKNLKRVAKELGENILKLNWIWKELFQKLKM
mgnify:CR=1 FL=1